MRALAVLGAVALCGCVIAHDWIARGASPKNVTKR